MTDCVFCRIATDAAPAFRVAEDEHCVAFLEKTHGRLIGEAAAR